MRSVRQEITNDAWTHIDELLDHQIDLTELRLVHRVGGLVWEQLQDLHLDGNPKTNDGELPRG